MRGRREAEEEEEEECDSGRKISLSSVLFARFIAARARFAGLIESGVEFNAGIINGPRN